MSFLLQLGDRLLIRWITRLIFLHMAVCVAAIAAVVALPLTATAFFKNVRMTSLLVSEGTVIELPLVERYLERWDAPSTSYLCYLPYGPLAVPHLRAENPADLDFLKVYEHPILPIRENGRTRMIEVPKDPNWQSVFRSVQGRSLAAAAALLILQALGTILAVFVAIRGYWLIKHGPRRPRWKH